MKEINRHILDKSIAELKNHQAPSEVWDSIEFALVDLPLTELPSHKAPSRVWPEIESSMRTSISFKTKRNSLVALLLLVSGIMIVQINLKDNKDLTSNNRNVTSGFNHLANDNSTIIVPPIDSNDIVLSESEETVNTDIKAIESVPVKDIAKTEYRSEVQGDEGFDIKESEDPAKNISLKSFPSKERVHFLSVSGNNEIIDLERPSLLVPKTDYCNFNRVDKSIHIGANIGYQVFVGEFQPAETQLQYWFVGDIKSRFTRNRFWLETGIGVSYSVDKSNFGYAYNKNELIDTYEYVDSVHYDPVTGITEYFTTTVEVWDSIEYTSSANLNQKYTYAYVPLKFGYVLLNNRNFCLDIAIGGNYYFEVSSKTEFPSIQHENSTITHIDNVTTQRNTQFYNLEGGIGINWKANEHIFLRFEPNVNYYPGNIYENIDNQSLSMNIKAGIYFKF